MSVVTAQFYLRAFLLRNNLSLFPKIIIESLKLVELFQPHCRRRKQQANIGILSSKCSTRQPSI